MPASILLSLVFFVSLLVTPAFAQSLGVDSANTGASASAELPDPLTPDAVRALVSRLNDEEVRALLLKQLDLVAKEQEAKANPDDQISVSEFVSQSIVGIGNNFAVEIQRLPKLFTGMRNAVGNFLDGRGFGDALQFVGLLIAAVLAGLAAEWLVNRVANRWRTEISLARPDTLMETLSTLSLRSFLDLIGLIAFALVTRLVIGLVMSAPMDQFIAWSFVLQLIVLVRVVSVVLRFVLAPSDSSLRLVSADDWTTRRMYRDLLIVAALIGLIGFSISALGSNGIVPAELRIGWWLNLMAYAWVIYAIWKVRAGITRILIGEEEAITPGTRQLAAWWPTIAIVLVFLNWVVIELVFDAGRFGLLQGQQNVALALILLTPVFDLVIRSLVQHLTPPFEGGGPTAERAYRQTRNSYVRIGRVILIVAEVLVVARLWDVKLLHLAQAGLGAEFAGRSVGALVILAAGYLAWELVNIWVNRNLANQPAETEDNIGTSEGGGRGPSRLATILPIVYLALQTTIIVTTILLALSHMGMNITALLAGAGIAGIAIGFGAQTLVRDIVSGLFYLMDDAFRVGEFVDISGTMGTVEKISVRALVLRHPRGAVHTIPYGQIPKLTNMSRDWVIVKLRFTVPFGTDVMKVKRLFKQISQQLSEDPEISDALIEPFKFAGVAEYDDVGIVVRGKFMAKAGKQFAARKAALELVRKGFEKEGIEFARREVRVHVPGLENATELDTMQKEAVAAGASQAAE